MAEFDINLGEVQYKPPLEPGQYTFAVVKAEPMQATNPNKTSGQREWYIKCELRPLEQAEYAVFHNWSLSNAALQVEDPVVSLKKLYEVMGWPVGSKINTDDLLQFRFSGMTKLEPFNGRLNPKLEKILGKVE
jgi:hypothetical protein